MKSREIIEIIADVVEKASQGCRITCINPDGTLSEFDCPEINYIFGNGQYVKERLDDLSKIKEGSKMKLPMIALFCPFVEQRNVAGYHSKAKVSILIAHATGTEWSNEQRLVYSFRNVLRPIYRNFIEALKEDRRLDFGYEGIVPHQYSENYSYGKYGAYASPDGEKVSQPIDAIDITNLELTVKLQNCR